MINIEKNIEVAKYTTLQIGGVAESFIEVKNKDDFVKALNFAKEKNLPFLVLGGGSNVLFAEEVYKGLVILNHTRHFNQSDDVFTIESGFNLAELVQKTISIGYKGLETLAGIPGSVGGAVRGNAGTRGGEIGTHVLEVEVWNNGEINHVPSSACDFEYRESRFKRDNEVILTIKLKLKKTEEDLQEIVKHTIQTRASKQPKGRTVGSFFKNPSGTRSAGELIDLCGLKGTQIGGAKIADEHGNWILNFDNASAKDVLDLMHLVQEKVEEKFKIKLIPEVQIIKNN